MSGLLEIGGTLNAELYRTADLIVDIAEERGIYFAVAFLYDAGYDTDRIKLLLPILEKTKNAVKN